MFLARIVGAGKPQVYPLTGKVFFPRSWLFVSYLRGACAIDTTPVLAVMSARRELRRRELKRILEWDAERPA